MAEGQSSFNPILAGGEGEEPGSAFSQSNPLFDETRVSKRGLLAREGEGPEGGGEVQLVERSKGAWLEKDYGFEHSLFGAKAEFLCGGVSKDKRYVCAGGGNGYLYYMDMSEGKGGKEAEDDEDKVKNGGVQKVEIEAGTALRNLAFGIEAGGNGGGGSVVYVGTDGGKVCEVNLSRGEVVRTFTGHDEGVYGIALSPNGKTLVTGSVETARVWDLTKEAAEGGDVEPIKVIEEEKMILSVAFNLDGTKFCFGGEDGFLHMYDSTSYERLTELKGHTDFIWSLTFSLDSQKLFTASEDKTLKIWDVAAKDAGSWTCKKTLVGHSEGVWRISVSPCGKYLASGSDDKTVKVWDITTGSLLRTIEAHEKTVYGVSFKKGGRIISASEDGKVKVSNLATKGRDALKLEGHEGGVKAVAISADGRTLVSGGDDNKVHIWDTETGKLKVKLNGHESEVTSVANSRDGLLVVSGSEDKTARVWKIKDGKATDDAGHTPLRVAIKRRRARGSRRRSRACGRRWRSARTTRRCSRRSWRPQAN